MSGSTNYDYQIALVQPTCQQGVKSLFTQHKNGKEGIGHKPPLAVLILGTYLQSENFKNVHCIDAQLDDLSPEQTVERLVKLNPDLVGFTVWTDFWYSAWKTVEILKKKLPHCKVILGGPHCSVFPKETLEASSADYVVRGDGEEVLLNLVKSLSSHQPVKEQPGLYQKQNGHVLEPSCDLATTVDPSNIPFPDRLLLPHERYTSVLSSKDFETTMITSRGCPHKCNFCKMDVQKVYCRTAEQVAEEFKAIADLGITDVQVYDDTFTWSKKRVIELCERLIDGNIKVNWAIRDRVKRADRDIYKLMKKAGCYRIHFGVETGSEPILQATGKATTLLEAEEALALAKQENFATMAYYMFGFPDETLEDAQKTIDFSLKLDADYSLFNIVIPYPGTSLYNLALTRNIIPYDFWLEYTKFPTPHFSIPHLIEQSLNRTDLIELKNTALRKHYLRPKRIYKEIKAIRSFKELKRKTNMAFDIFSDIARPLFGGNSTHHESPNINTYRDLQNIS
jgi:anaerobic magnesium-protoporphyrin IX monomethyl ester cyclase